MAKGARAPRAVKLLLDVHHSAVIAAHLLVEGYDVAAAVNDSTMARLSDEELLRAATADGRAVVTENVGDFSRIARAWGTFEEHHAGIVFTLRSRFYRGTAAYPGSVIAALGTLLDAAPPSTVDRIFWLP